MKTEHSAHLTERERAVLICVATGMSNAEVADCLQCSVRTVEAHLTSIYNKYEVDNRVKAINKGRETGAIPRV